MGFAEVAVDRPAHPGASNPQGLILTYTVPGDLAVQPGHLVLVPLGKQVVQGIVVALTAHTALANVREVLRLVDPVAVLTPEQLALGRWLAGYYRCPLY